LGEGDNDLLQIMEPITSGALPTVLSGGDGLDTAVVNISSFTADVVFSVVSGANLPGNVQLTGVEAVALATGSGNDSLTGGAFADQLSGGDGNDTLQGGAGNDFLSPGNGNDETDGGEGNDVITAFNLKTGRKQLLGGAGDDTMNGSDT